MAMEASDHRGVELQAIMSHHVMLGIKFRSSEGAQSMCHHGAISPGQQAKIAVCGDGSVRQGLSTQGGGPQFHLQHPS